MPTTLITGANRGIGLALTQEFIARGWDVIATARNPGTADVLNTTDAEVHALDVTDFNAVGALAASLDGRAIDLLINNAGIGGDHSGLGNINVDSFRATMDTNVIAPIKVIEAFTPHVAAGQHKLIANLSSLLGSIEATASGWALIYRTSKAGLNMALRAAATTLADKGITVLTLHPGHVETDMGGVGAPVKPADSAKGLAEIILSAGPAKSLRFFDYQGNTLAW